MFDAINIALTIEVNAIKANAVTAYVNFAALAVLGFITSPLLVKYLGAAHFGLWKTCLLVFSFASVADGRATQALKWAIAFREKDTDVLAKQREIGSSLIIWLMWFPVLLTVILTFSYVIPLYINGLTQEDISIARNVGLILGANALIGALLGVPDAVLVGTNQGFRSTRIVTAFLVVSNIATVGVASFGYGLPEMAAVTVVMSVLASVLTWQVAARRVAWWGVAKPRWPDIKKLGSFSNWTLLGAVMQVLFLSSELFLFSILLGPVAVTNYIFTSYLAQFAIAICLMTGSALTPRLGALVGAKERSAARALITQGREIVFAIAIAIASATLLLNQQFIYIWVGSAYYLGDSINALIAVSAVQIILIRYDGQVQDVCLQIRTKVLVGLAGCVICLAAAWVAYRTTDSVVGMYLGLIAGRVILSLSFPQFVATMVGAHTYDLRRLFAGAIILALSYLAGRYMLVSTWVEFAAVAAVGLSLVALALYFTVLSNFGRSLIRDAYRGAIRS